MFFDSWAWWEVLYRTPTGNRLWKRYGHPGVKVHTSALSLAEISSKLGRTGAADRIDRAVAQIESRSQVHAVDPETAKRAGRLHEDLRQRHPHVGLADAIILATAKSVPCALVTADRGLRGRSDVYQR